MNFLFKIILLLAFSIYGFATCTTAETNASNSLRLAHSVCPKLFTPNIDKEKFTVYFYRNTHDRGLTQGHDITVTLNLNKKFTQPWITNLGVTLTNLKNQIDADGEFKAIVSGYNLIIEAVDTGYKVDPVVMGGTPQVGEYIIATGEGNLTSAEVNVTAYGTRKGADAIAEKVLWEFNQSTNGVQDINFSHGIRKIKFFANTGQSAEGSDYNDVNRSFLEVSNQIKKIGDSLATITVKAGGNITAISKELGNKTTMQIVFDYNSSTTSATTWTRITIGGTGGKGFKRILQAGVNAIASVRRIYYYGNEGNYSIKFWHKDLNIGNNSNNTVFTIETPYLTSMSSTLNRLSTLIDANTTYNSIPTPLSPHYGYLTLTDRTPRATEHNLSGKSGNGRAKIIITKEGKATPEDINMTSISYNDNFLYTTFDIDYDINESDSNYSSAKQDILEIFEVSHIYDNTNAALNTIDLTSAVVLRHDDNVSSVVSGNDIVFLGDENSTYYKFNRTSAVKTLTAMQQVKEPNEIDNVQANMAEHYQDGYHAYVFLADGKKMRVYKIGRNNAVTHYITFYNFGGIISDINRDGQYLYVQSNEGDRLTKFLIVDENNRFSIERSKTFTLDAEKIYVRDNFIYYTVGSTTNKDKGMRAKIGNTMIEDEEIVEKGKVSFMIGDEFYSASIGMDGLKIYDYNGTLNSADGAYSGSKILILGEFIITDDLNSSQIRVYKFGKVDISSREGEGSPSKPFYLDMLANKINLEDINWTIRKNLHDDKITLRQKRPTYPFTESGLWYIEAVVKYKDYKLPSIYTYRFNVIEDNAPGVEINASSMSGLKGLNVKFTSIITKNSYVDYIVWDFNDTNKSISLPATSTMMNPSWKFEEQGDYNVTLIVYYDRDKNITKNIMIHISSPLEMNTTNVEGNATNTHIKGDDINFSANILDNADFYTLKTSGGVLKKVPDPTKSYTWSFGDGDSSVSYLEKPIFAYKVAGNYEVKLEIIKEDSNGNDIKYTSKKMLSIVDFQQPTIIADKLSGETPLTVNFNVSLKGYLVKDIRPKSISWTFTNGGVSSKQNPSFTFERPAINGYVVIAKVELSDGNTLTLEKTITVNDKVDLEIEANAKEGYSPLTINLVAVGSSFEGINRYEWEIGLKGQEKVKKTGTSIEHTFDSNGTYEINATAFSNKDHNGTANLTIKVEKGPDVTIVGELVNPATDLTTYKFTANEIIKQGETASFEDKNTSWFINDVEIETEQPSITYKFLESMAYKIEFRVVLKGGNIVKYVYDRNPSFNPYVKKVKVYTGWNLISSPLDEKFVVVAANDPVPEEGADNIQRLRDISSVIWKFTNNGWQKNPTIIDKRVGFWIKATVDKELIFDGNTDYEPDLINSATNPFIPGKWYLLGTGKKLIDYKGQNSSLKVVWVYKKGKWYKNPSIIEAGDGLWVKAQ